MPDVVEALAKIFEEHFGVNLVGREASPKSAGELEQPSVPTTIEPVPEKKEDSIGERLAKLGRVK